MVKKIMEKNVKSLNDILTKKLKLIEEAIEDFNKGDLSSIAAIAAISWLASASSEPSKDAVRWAKDNLIKNNESGFYEREI